MYKVKEANTVFLFGFRTAYGGGSSTGFALIYDSIEDAKKFEPRYRLARVCIFLIIHWIIVLQSGLTKAREGSRKQIKEKKNRAKKVFGVGRRVAKHKAKKANKA